MISVVIPLYNKELYIENTIQSLLNQTFSEFEILIVNDGSTDQSLQKVSSFNDSRIRILIMPNQGVSATRNKGVEEARFPWIAFLDADDWWHRDFLKMIAAAIKANPKDKIFATSRNRVFESKVERYQNSVLPKPETTGRINYFEVLTKDLPPINSSNVVIDKNLLIEKGLFKEGMKQHEDHDLWIRICEKNEIVFINKVLSFYRKTNEDSASQRIFSAKDFYTYLSTIKIVYEAISVYEKQCLKQYYQKFICIRYFQNAYHFNNQEKESLYGLFRKLKMNKKYKVLLWLVHGFAFLNLFGLYKKLKY